MADIKKRKTRLQDDLDLLEKSFENRFQKAQRRVFGSVEPVNLIKKKPLQAVGIAVMIGFALSISRKKSIKSDDTVPAHSHDNSQKRKIGFTGILYDEIKRIAARRAAAYMSEWIDQKMSSK